MKGLRYQQGSSYIERMAKGAEDLADLRGHRGYAYLMDMLDGELRALWRTWISVDVSPEKAEGIRQRAIWLSDFIRSIDEKTGEKAWMDEMERVYLSSHVDGAITAEMAAASATGVTPGGKAY